jgi:hypothetical protein
MVAAELKGVKNNEMVAIIKKKTHELVHKVKSLQRHKSRLLKAEEELESLKAGKIPAGIRPFALSYETQLLDSTKAPAISPIGPPPLLDECSVREAKEKLYVWHLAAQKWLDTVILKPQIDELKRACKKEIFVTECCQKVGKQVSPLAVLGIEDDTDMSENTEDTQLRAKVLGIYMKVISDAAQKKQKEEDLQRRKSDEKQKLVTELLKKTPDEWLTMAIDERIKGKGKGSAPSKVQQAAKIYQLVQSGTASESTITPLLPPKNGVSPASGGGTIKSKDQQKTAKGKGKAKGKSQGKGKSKQQDTKAQQLQQKPKGKGKTKSKGEGAKAPAKGKGKGKGKQK